jgi:predicted amidophosphoribosyltransferase
MEIRGNWDAGVVLSPHMGDDGRTPMGEALYRLKYASDLGALPRLLRLISAQAARFIRINAIDMLVPVPPSTRRDFQPVAAIAYEIAQATGTAYEELLEKSLGAQVKSSSRGRRAEALSGAITLVKSPCAPANILLLDDLYETGKTLQQCTYVLRGTPNIGGIYALAITRTKK